MQQLRKVDQVTVAQVPRGAQMTDGRMALLIKACWRFYKRAKSGMCKLNQPSNVWIFMKFYMVVNYYLVSLSFNFHENLCANVRVRVVNVRTQDKTCAHLYAQIFMKETYAHKIVIDRYPVFTDTRIRVELTTNLEPEKALMINHLPSSKSRNPWSHSWCTVGH